MRNVPLVAVAVAGSSLVMFAGVAVMATMMSGMGHRGGDVAASPTIVAQTAVGIDIADFTFAPSNVSVPVGARVTWINRDSAPHDATANEAGWATDTLNDGDSGTIEFTEPGSFEYHCSIHPYMRGVISVRAAD